MVGSVGGHRLEEGEEAGWGLRMSRGGEPERRWVRAEQRKQGQGSWAREESEWGERVNQRERLSEREQRVGD
eukprot:6213424-Pleurochrysis_carterae.AAC.1